MATHENRSALGNSLVKQLAQIRLEKTFTDVVLECENEEIPAHRVVLGIGSPVFKAMLMENNFVEGETQRIKINDIELSTLRHLLDFIYEAKIDPIAHFSSLYSAADKYDIQDLFKECEKLMISNLSVPVAAEYFYKSFLHGGENLKNASAKIIIDNFQEIKKTDGWKSLLKTANSTTVMVELLDFATKGSNPFSGFKFTSQSVDANKDFFFGGTFPDATSSFKMCPRFKFRSATTTSSTTTGGGFTFGSSPAPGLKFSEEKTSTKGVDLSESKNLPTFASLASGSGSGFGFGSTQKTTSFAFSGAGTPVFVSGTKKEGDKIAEDRDGKHVDTGDHNLHFEPIIPLPDLVEVITGEEDEEELFAFKGKMFRYDGNTKEWKERGVGKVKILKHKKLETFRVLLRREQIHKIAVNHAIIKEIALKPMPSSTNALCYYAMDFSEEELKNEYLAVKFKLEETVQEFKKIFEECQKQIPKKGALPINQEPKKEVQLTIRNLNRL